MTVIVQAIRLSCSIAIQLANRVLVVERNKFRQATYYQTEQSRMGLIACRVVHTFIRWKPNKLR